jgi:hypothetical protein
MLQVKIDDHVVYSGFGKEIENEEELNAVLSLYFTKCQISIVDYMIEMVNSSKDFVDGSLIPAIKRKIFQS